MVAPFQVQAQAPIQVMLNPLAWLIWILDFAIWLLTLIGPAKFLGQFARGPATAQKDGAIFRLKAVEDKLLTTPMEGCNTVHDLLQRSFDKYAEKPALGTRTYLGEHTVPGGKFPLKKFGETKWETYGEFGYRANGFGAGLRKLGLEPAPTGVDLQSSDGPHTILIFEETCAQWAISMAGAFSQSIAVATSYATLGMSAVADAINETKARAIVCNIKDASKVAEHCKKECKSLAVIIYTTNCATQDDVEKYLKAFKSSDVKLHSVDDVVKMGYEGSKKPNFSPPTPDHLAVIMYTSGSTGKPKGVMIKHSSFVASIAAIKHKFEDLGMKEGEETYLAYLPAAHILELVAEMSNLCMGTAIGFACPKTISSKGAVRERPDGTLNTKPEYPHPPGGIQEFRPTVMAAVPKIWDILKKGVEEVVGKSSPLKRLLFQIAYSGRYLAVTQGREAPLLKGLVFKKLSQMLGGRLKVGISGGGPISADVQNFIRTAFAMPLLQGYALTESTCAGTIQMGYDCRNGVVGPPVASVEMKLRDCIGPDGEAEVLDRNQKKYLSTDTSHYGMPCKGRGEVLIRGPSVSSGYFKQPENTKKAYKDGWFSSGDVGIWTTDGALMIVDRLKNLVKLKGGEYIAIESMEKEYNTSAYVSGITGGVMCYGDGDMDRPIAFVQVNAAELEKWAKEAGVAYKDIEELCKKPEAEKCVLENMHAIHKAKALGGNEKLLNVVLISGTGSMEKDLGITSPWTPENGGLTASNKLNRKPIIMALEDTLKKLKKAQQ